MTVLPFSPKLGLEFTPLGAEEETPPPRYFYRPPDGRDRERWRARMMSIAGEQHSPRQLRAILEAGISSLCDDESDRAALLALREAYEQSEEALADIQARLDVARGLRNAAEIAQDGSLERIDASIAELEQEAAGARMTPEQIGQIEELDATLRQHYPPYARALERQQLFQALAPRVACNMFCTGWSNVTGRDAAPVVFKRVNGEVPDPLLDRLPLGHLLQLGAVIINAMFVSQADAKKADSPSGSAGASRSSATPNAASSSSAPTAKDG